MKNTCKKERFIKQTFTKKIVFILNYLYALFRVYIYDNVVLSIILAFYTRRGGSCSLNGFQILALCMGDDPA